MAFLSSDLLRGLIIALLGVLGPALYALLTGLDPNIPISETQFTQFLVWLISSLLFGSGATIAHQGARSYILLQHQPVWMARTAAYVTTTVLLALYVVIVVVFAL